MDFPIAAVGASDGATISPIGCSEALAAEIRQIEGPLHCISGATLYARVIQPDDTQRLQAFHSRLSTDSIVYRFFRYMPTLPDEEAMRLTHLDYDERMALVAVQPNTTGAPEPESELMGVVRYEGIEHGVAEVAFVVADLWQGQGIATALLHRLAAYARRRGITTFMAVTMSGNGRMFEVLRNAGYPLKLRHDGDEATVLLDITQPARGEPEIKDVVPAATSTAPSPSTAL